MVVQTSGETSRDDGLRQLDAALGRRRLIVVTGKGGVGKTLLTALLGQRLAAAGRRTLLLEVDRRENLHQLLAVPPSGGEVVTVADRLYLQNLKPSRVVDWVVEKKLKLRPLVSRVQKSPVYQRFVEGAPGLTELAIVGHALRLVRGDFANTPDLDTVILDAPATGHGLSLLRAPQLVAEAIGSGPFFDLAQEVATFVEDPAETGVVIVTLAEEMPVQEALELRQGLEEQSAHRPQLLVVNGLYPVAPKADDGGPLEDLWRHRRQINERELARLESDWPGARVHLPLLPLDEGRQLVQALGAVFADGFGVGADDSADETGENGAGVDGDTEAER